MLQVAATCCTKKNLVLLLVTNPDVACGGGNTGNKALQLAHTMLRRQLQGNVARITALKVSLQVALTIRLYSLNKDASHSYRFAIERRGMSVASPGLMVVMKTAGFVLEVTAE